jgi:hypothetical protein
VEVALVLALERVVVEVVVLLSLHRLPCYPGMSLTFVWVWVDGVAVEALAVLKTSVLVLKLLLVPDSKASQLWALRYLV